jgi:hypothetical protein
MHRTVPSLRSLSFVLWSLVSAIACGDTTNPGGPGPGPTPQAAIQASASPSPIPLVVCPPSNCGSGGPTQAELVTTITLRESGGVGGRVTGIGVTLRRDHDNATVVSTTIAAASILVSFPANGTVTLPFALHASQNDLTAQSTLTLVVNATDANNRAVTANLTIPVGGPATSAGLFITGNYQIVQAAVSNSCGDTGTPATVTGWVTMTGSDSFQLRDTGGTTFTGTVGATGGFVANAVFGPDGSGQTYTQRLEGNFTSGAGFTGRLDVAVSPRNCAFTRDWTGTRAASLQ